MLRPVRRPGVSLVEVLVVAAVAGVLVAVTLPAVQRARESSNRTRCQNNLKQIGLAEHGYVEAHGRFAVTTGGDGSTPNEAPRASVLVYLLPHLDQDPLFRKWDFGYHWYHDQNAEARSTRVKTFECPSAVQVAGFVVTEWGRGNGARYTPTRPDGRTGSGGVSRVTSRSPTGPWLVRDVAVSHYGPYDGVDSPVRGRLPDLPWAEGNPERPGDVFVFGALFADGQGTPVPAQITDGLSQTVFFTENAGRPAEYWLRAERPGQRNVSGAGWASAKLDFDLDGVRKDDGRFESPTNDIPPAYLFTGTEACVMNCNSDNEAYSFHPGGVNVLLGDGSARWVGESVPLGVWAAAVTPAAGDVPPADW